MDDRLPHSHYETLDIPNNANPAMVRSAFRNLVLACHPDRVLDKSKKEQKAEQFRQIQQAYGVLSDPGTRQRYDEEMRLPGPRAETTEEREFLPPPPRSSYGYGYPEALWPPQLNSGYSLDKFSPNRPPSYVSNDSGHTTRFFPEHSQQSANCTLDSPRSPAIEVIHRAPMSSSYDKKQGRPSFPCLYPNCGHISTRAHDHQRHMTMHFPPSLEERLDCRYEWCGRTGAHGFTREDHRKEHYRKVHMKESDYPRMSSRQIIEQLGGRKDLGDRSSQAASTAHFSAVFEDKDMTMKTEASDRMTIATERNRPPPGNQETLALLSNVKSRLRDMRPPEIYGNAVDQEDAVLKVSIPGEDLETPKTSDTNVSESESWTSLDSSKSNGLGPCSDDETTHEEKKVVILSNTKPRFASEHTDSIEMVLDETEPLMASKSRHPPRDRLAVIRSQVLGMISGSPTGQYSASLNIRWNILAFMEEQYRDNEHPNTALGPIVTISGFAQHAQATTCSDYIQQNWPAYGTKILDALQHALDSPTQTSQSKIVARIGEENTSSQVASSGFAEFEFDVTAGFVHLNVTSGSPKVIVDIVQQLTWMGTALRTSTDGQIQYCEPKLRNGFDSQGMGLAISNVTFETSSPSEEDQSCWFSLFRNPVIAHGFPTARRKNHEVGLEIPLDMMAALGGARHAVDFEGGLVLKGYSALFVPIKRHEDSVQWHLIHAMSHDRISYREASVQCPTRALLKDLNHQALKTTRTYLGWWKDAETHLATAHADYENIDWSKAKEAGPSPRLTGGTLGVSNIVSATVSFVLGAKDGPLHFSQHEPFQKTVDRAERSPVVLYDQKDRRAWLVTALPVILHMIQLRNHIKPFVVGGKRVHISPLDPSRQGHAAREVVAKNKSQKLFDCESNGDKEYFFRDALLDAWSILDRLMERETATQATPGVAVHATWQSTLYGWEFRAVVDEDTHLKQKGQVLEKTAGRWYDLVKDVGAVVLFASGLGDIIKPRSDLSGLCCKWKSLPKDKDYLAVGVPMLEMFYAKAGHRQDHQYLTSAKLQWHRGSTLFEQCTGDVSNCCSCDRVQQVYHDSWKIIGHRTPPGRLEANGCVAFGQAHHSMKPTTKPLAKSMPLYTLSNDHIQSQAISRPSSWSEDSVIQSGFITHLKTYYNESDRTRMPSPERPRSPLWGGNEIPLDGFVKLKGRRRTLPHPRITDLNGRQGLDEAMQNSSTSPEPKTCAEQKNATLPNGNVVEPKRRRSLMSAHVYHHVTVPKVNSYRVPGDSCQHLNGCSCESHFEANLESR